MALLTDWCELCEQIVSLNCRVLVLRLRQQLNGFADGSVRAAGADYTSLDNRVKPELILCIWEQFDGLANGSEWAVSAANLVVFVPLLIQGSNDDLAEGSEILRAALYHHRVS